MTRQHLIHQLRMIFLVTMATISYAEILQDVYIAVDSNTIVTGKITKVQVRGNVECSNRYVVLNVQEHISI